MRRDYALARQGARREPQPPSLPAPSSGRGRPPPRQGLRARWAGLPPWHSARRSPPRRRPGRARRPRRAPRPSPCCSSGPKRRGRGRAGGRGGPAPRPWRRPPAVHGSPRARPRRRRSGSVEARGACSSSRGPPRAPWWHSRLRRLRPPRAPRRRARRRSSSPREGRPRLRPGRARGPRRPPPRAAAACPATVGPAGAGPTAPGGVRARGDGALRVDRRRRGLGDRRLLGPAVGGPGLAAAAPFLPKASPC